MAFHCIYSGFKLLEETMKRLADDTDRDVQQMAEGKIDFLINKVRILFKSGYVTKKNSKICVQKKLKMPFLTVQLTSLHQG